MISTADIDLPSDNIEYLENVDVSLLASGEKRSALVKKLNKICHLLFLIFTKRTF
jgi:hypothetical protein